MATPASALTRSIDDVMKVLDWAKANGANTVRVGDVMIGWEPQLLPPHGHALGLQGVSGAQGTGGNVVDLAAHRGSQRGLNETQALSKLADVRRAQETATGLPEFRSVEEILEAEARQEAGHGKPPPGGLPDPEKEEAAAVAATNPDAQGGA